MLKLEMLSGEEARQQLGVCHGYGVVAEDGVVGYVETPLFLEAGDVDYLVVRVERPDGSRFPIVPAARVTGVDRARELLCVTGTRDEVASLPENLPLDG